MSRKRISYAEKLRDRRWQQKRLEILKRDNFCCQFPHCDSTTSMLDVHHKAYIRNSNPWEYPDYCLITLCQQHHEYEQNRLEEAHLAIARNPTLVTYCIENGRDLEASTIRKNTEVTHKELDLEVMKSWFQKMREAIEND